jgi:K+ transporter
VLHQQVVLLVIVNERVPQVPSDERLMFEDKGQGFSRVNAPHLGLPPGLVVERGMQIDL